MDSDLRSEHQTTSSRKPLFFWFVVLLAAITFAFYCFAGLMIYRYGNLTKDYGWKYDAKGQSVYYISEVDPRGPAAGALQVGDQIIAINEDTRISKPGVRLMWVKLRSIAPGNAYTIRVMRGTEDLQFQLKAVGTAHDHEYVLSALSRLMVSIPAWIVGLLIGILKAEQRTTRIYCITFIFYAISTIDYALAPIAQFFHPFAFSVCYIIGALGFMSMAFGYYFFYRFPPGAPKGKLWSIVGIFLFSWTALLAATEVVMRVVLLQPEQVSIRILLQHYDLLRFINVWPYRFNSLTWQVAPVFIFAVLVRNYRVLKEPDQRRRIQWIVYAMLAAVVPFAVIFLLELAWRSIWQVDLFSTGTRKTLNYLPDLAGILPSLALGYAILKHRLFDIHVVIRRSVQYLLAKNVLRVLLSLPLIALAYAIYTNRNETLVRILFHNSIYFYLAVAASFGLKFRTRLTESIDRKFFRENYNQEKILANLIEEIKKLDTIYAISELVSARLASALHPKSLYLFYLEFEKRHLSLRFSSGVSLERVNHHEDAQTQTHDHKISIPEEFQIIRLLEKLRNPQELSSLAGHGLPQTEKEWFETFGVHLIVPFLGTDDRVVGLLLLGEKKSEEPYSRKDIKLLESLAAEIAILYEVELLKERMDKEQKIKQEVLSRLGDQKFNLLKECPECGGCYDSSHELCAKDQSELNFSLPVERTIEGRYRLDRLLGKGGMGAVYEATDLRLNRAVAIKVMMGRLFGDRISLRRFEREAQASARLNHPNIIAIYDYGAIPTEGAFLTMEFVKGSTLREVLKQTGKVDPLIAADWFDQLLEGIGAAHRASIIHRDLKPENVFIAKGVKNQSTVKILDFGLAKIKLADISNPNSLTVPGTVLGTLHYMSPEQISGQELNERTDIFSIGVMAVEVLTGSRPFEGKTSEELLVSILHKPFHLGGNSNEVKRLDEILGKCLAKNPTARYSSAAQLQEDLMPAIRNCSAVLLA